MHIFFATVQVTVMSCAIWCISAALFVLHLQLCNVRITSAQFDGTLEPNRIGSSVVRAVIAKITASEIFDQPGSWWRQNTDKFLFMIFMRRLAYVETEDGLNQASLGGIWKVTEGVFKASNVNVCNSNNNRSRIMINKSLLNVDWCSVSYDDMSRPLYSGLSAALYLDELFRNNTIRPAMRSTNQMHLWWRHFNRSHLDQTDSSLRKMWKKGVESLSENERCSTKFDVVFVMDSSISIIPSHFRQANALVCNFVNNSLDGPANQNRVGVILIGTVAVEYKPLDEILTRGNINTTLTEVCTLPHLRQFTNTADGLCTLSRQEWRPDAGVLKLAIVLTDGKSNGYSQNCDGNNTKEMANLIHINNSDVLVFAVGVGSEVSGAELEMIASRTYLTSHVIGYNQVPDMSETFNYQICHTMSARTRPGNQENGALGRNEKIRWVLDGVGSKGVTVRLCVRDGSITLYVSQLTVPDEEYYDNKSSIARTDRLAIVCSTIFNIQYHNPGTRSLRSVEQGETTSLYLLIEGHDEMSNFFLQSGDGNVTFDVNECEQYYSPCHQFALCYNTDGSFYCECQHGYTGDGFECSSNLFELAAFLIPSVVLGVSLLAGLLLVSIVGIWLRCRSPTQSPSQERTPTPFTTAKFLSATNPLAINTHATA